MRRFSFLISRYVLQAILPYFLFTWLLLSVIFFVQQAGKYSDLLFNTALPSSLVWQLTIALIPNVLSFTCPIAVLVGVIIGLSRMQGDSEMVSLRAAGVGNLQIALPIVLIGLLLSAFAFTINLKGVPLAAQIVRQVALKAALYKLESPIEPGLFNSEINGFTIYVKNGNIEDGNWENIFIYHDDKANKQVRLITSKKGRIDTRDENSEIVLDNATVTTLDLDENNQIISKDSPKKIVSENVGSLRWVVQTKRREIIDRLAKSKEIPEEMGLYELSGYINTLEGREKREAQVLWQRRILLSITPIIFALLGTALVLKFNRGGRGFGVFLSLLSLVIYYLLMLLGEQLARNGTIPITAAALMPLGASIIAIFWFFLSKRLFITKSLSIRGYFNFNFQKSNDKKVSPKNTILDFTTGILDFDLILNLIKNYILTVSFLTIIFLVFTAFEHWKFAGSMEGGVNLLVKYLFYLIPFVYINVAPSALMIATLATYVIKSRQNEIVTWTAAGQSVYRLLLPCFILMILLGFLNFGLQEYLFNKTNRVQDSVRAQLRSRNKILTNKKSFWITSENKVISFTKEGASDNPKSVLDKIIIFKFDKDFGQIKRFIRANNAKWDNGEIILSGKVEDILFKENETVKSKKNSLSILNKVNPFKSEIVEPNHLNISEMKNRLNQSKSEIERVSYLISIQKKYTTIFLPFIITLFTAPFALTLSRKGNVVTIAYAFATWLSFMGMSSVFTELGQSGYLSPSIAIWSPLVMFTIIGLYLLTKVKT